jgi:hypothetical protein
MLSVSYLTTLLIDVFLKFSLFVVDDKLQHTYK